MKKKTLGKKLTLPKETLHLLERGSLEKAVAGDGGGTTQPGLTINFGCTRQDSICLC